MTDEEMRIAIARAMGKKVCDHSPDLWNRHGPDGDSELYCTACKAYLSDMRIADFPNDLNAMHEAIKSMDYNELMQWHVENRDVAYRNRTSPELTDARQRAEAYLRVRGKYKE